MGMCLVQQVFNKCVLERDVSTMGKKSLDWFKQPKMHLGANTPKCLDTKKMKIGIEEIFFFKSAWFSPSPSLESFLISSSPFAQQGYENTIPTDSENLQTKGPLCSEGRQDILLPRNCRNNDRGVPERAGFREKNAILRP